MNTEILILISMLGVMLTEIILIRSILRLTKQLKLLSERLDGAIGIVEVRLKDLVDKVNFDIPAIMGKALDFIKFFKGAKQE